MNWKEKGKKVLIAGLLLVWSGYSSFNFAEPIFRRVKSIDSTYSKIQTLITENGEEISVGVFKYPDGETGLRVLNPEKIIDSSISFVHSLSSPEDLTETILMLGLLEQYKAKKISLSIDDWRWDVTSDEDRYILQILKLFAEEINVGLKGEKGTEFKISLPAVPDFEKKLKPFHIDEVLYIQDRFEDEAEQAVAGLQEASTSQINIEKKNGFHWKVNLPSGLKGKNVVLIHSTENAENIAELLLTLFKLREAGVGSISLINTYQGYARQDKEFEPGEGISAYTVLKLFNRFLDYNFPINVHYGNKSGVTWLSNREIYIQQNGRKEIIQTLPALKVNNLNGFIQLAESMTEKIIGQVGEKGFLNYLERYPLLFIAPDDGSFPYLAEAEKVLEPILYKAYPQLVGRDLIKVGYLEKKRLSPEETEIQVREILGEGGKPINISYDEIDNYWIGILDDETATGGTLKKAVYHLVGNLQADRNKIYAGVVHGKFVYGLEKFFQTKPDEMLPDSFFVLDTLPLAPEIETYDIQIGSIFPLIRYAIKRILGQPVGQ